MLGRIMSDAVWFYPENADARGKLHFLRTDKALSVYFQNGIYLEITNFCISPPARSQN
jgi:hypothetical protein